ncbi:nitrite reductase small subunit NirD [Sedimenticola hydrogenitrophicus]|uniref:nitrite reductase small subunit NirD n=1 Tax=Sedimenticola hydrogenitrophicus TaxID=2967975 RepID=UPI0023B1B3BA|nr:nitrite reductase small subunit NirD [Sedimenticola hydrogenitrophicus]
MSAVLSEKWVEIGNLDEIPKLGSRVVRTASDEIAIFRAADDRVFALSNRCPHKQGPLSEGILHGHRVTCPLHNWVIELENGQAVAPDVGCAKSYPVRLEGEMILLAI